MRPLDANNRRRIAARLKNMSRTAYSQLDGVEAYANLKTCRREHLLRHFGDAEEVAPCDGCDVCQGEAVQSVPEPAATPSLVAGQRLRCPTSRDGLCTLRTFAELARRSGAEPKSAGLRGAAQFSHRGDLHPKTPDHPRTGLHKRDRTPPGSRYGEEILVLVHGDDAGGNDAELAYRGHLEAAEPASERGTGGRRPYPSWHVLWRPAAKRRNVK